MSYIEKRNEVRPASGEAPFSLDEVFFSRTDGRGVIQAGNYVFRRVANFEWTKLLGVPHKVIRHPDMPKGVFWLLWNRIKQGQTMGAYVKNRAQDGLYYWVFALVAPLPSGGYLSARIKPTTPLFGQIEKEYSALRAAEQEEGLTPEQSAKRLLARLASLGYADYSRFATHALTEELVSRAKALGQPSHSTIGSLQQMFTAAESLTNETNGLINEFEMMRTVPHNMRVIASRLEPTGGPVSTLSKNYGAISQEMSDWFAHYAVGEHSNFASISGSVDRSLFLEGMAQVLLECDTQLRAERRKLGEIDIDAERRIVSELLEDNAKKTRAGLAQVRDEAQRILAACDTMNRHVLGLSSTRVLCKIESARLPGAGEGLADIITQLGTFQERISNRLDRIGEHSSRILALLP